MNERLLLIVFLGLAVIGGGLLVLRSTSKRYRRDLGLEEGPPEKTQDVSFIINAFQDVTRQLKEKERELERLRSLAEQRAENAESSTENILQCVSDGVVSFGGDGRVTTMNRAAQDILGMTAAQAVGRSCGEVIGSPEVCRLVQETLDRRSAARRIEAELLRGGERLLLGFTTALLSDRGGRPLGAILSFSDLTEMRRLQEQVELKERLTALGEMSAGIAHELRNPMAVIAGYLNLLAKKVDAAGQTTIRDIRSEISGMDRIISDLLTFARPASLNRTAVDLREMLESSVHAVLQAKGNASGISASMDVPAATVLADEVLLRQALGNLVQNAVEAMPDGGKLSVIAQAGRETTIIVKDNGAGIPQDNLRKVFLPFFTTKDRGVGMGLALTHKIVTAHGGRISVESREGQGTAFTVVLPAG